MGLLCRGAAQGGKEEAFVWFIESWHSVIPVRVGVDLLTCMKLCGEGKEKEGVILCFLFPWCFYSVPWPFSVDPSA